MPKILIIDCNNLSYSSFHTFGELTFQEKKTGVIFGFLQRVLFLAKKFQTNKFLFCWDSKRSYRKLIYPDYKGQRRKDLSESDKVNLQLAFGQFDALREKVLPGLGFGNVFRQTGYEADDLMAELVLENDANFVLVSTDKDLYQLLHRCNIFNQKTKQLITGTEFRKRYNLSCRDWVKAKALMGDSSDNIPGILGVGEVKAIQYIHNALSGGKILERIKEKESREIRRRNTKLMKLPYKGIKKIKMSPGVDEFKKEKFIDIFADYGFESFLRQKSLNNWVHTFIGH